MENEKIKPGVYVDLSNEAYHGSEGISKSGLDLVAKCPALYEYRYLKGNRPEPTKAMTIGSAVHTAALEPQLFNDEYVLAPNVNKRTKEGKMVFAEFERVNADKTVLSVEEYDLCMGVSDAVRSHPIAKDILSYGEAETSIFHEDLETGELVKVRPDWMHEDLIVDLKTTQCASADDFSKSCFNFRYFVQSGMYLDVANAAMGNRFSNFLFICVEKTAPYQVSIFFADEEMLALGREEYRKALELYKQCRLAGYWPGYNSDEITPISLPYWASKKLA